MFDLGKGKQEGKWIQNDDYYEQLMNTNHVSTPWEALRYSKH